MLRNFWYVAATTDELGTAPVDRIVCGTPVVLFRREEGGVAAVQNYCSHRRAPLAPGRVVGNAIECPYHGMRFAADGRCVHIPSQSDIPARAHITAFPVIERQGLIWIWPGDPAMADAAKVPDLPWRSDPNWCSYKVHYYHVRGSHMLMTENLLDLGHVAFIHADTIGFDPVELAEDPLEVRVEGDKIISTREFRGVKPGPAVARWGNFTGLIDRRSKATWSPPCFTSIEFSFGDGTTSLDTRIDHLITPETERTHNYWVAISRNFKIDDDEFSQKMRDDNDAVHVQDLAIVEAQQRMIDLVPDYRDMPLRQDRAITIAHRTIARLAREEQGAATGTAAA